VVARTVYRIQRLDGYTDGKPSWISTKPWPAGMMLTEEGAKEMLKMMRKMYPKKTFRLRKVQ
jgi:hypothetical protein